MLDIRTGKEICTNECTNKCTNKCRNVSRRDFGKGIAAILAAGCAPTIVSGAMMRMTGARMATMMSTNPYDTEVAYLESHGTEYIITEIVPQSDRGIIVEFAYTGYTSGYGRMFGTQKDGIGKTLTIRQTANLGGNINVEFGTVSRVYSFDLNKHILTVNNPVGTFLFDSSTISEAYIGAITYPCWIFGNNGASSGFAKGRIYRVTEVSNSNVTTDLIPVVKSGVGYMYDKVSGRLFGNSSGTGAFTWG